MTAIHLDAVGGIAGDMFVAALLDAFPDLRGRVLADATAVLPVESGAPQLDEGQSGGIRTLRFRLAGAALTPVRRRARVMTTHDHDHGHPHDHAHDVAPDHRHDEDTPTAFADLVTRITAARLSPGTAGAAVAILTILADAEAEVHGIARDRVHFHELADWDSLMDVVAAGSIAASLAGATWTVSPLPRGGGLVRTRHGLLPVPAPATTLILRGFDWRDDGVPGERVTPTGAAILKHLATDAGTARPGGRLITAGTGAGTRALPGIPNVLRALVFDDEALRRADTVAVVAFEVDDMTGEEIATAADRLRAEAGVLDLSIGQRWGKKGRPMQSFRLLLRPDAADAVIGRCFAETSTIGLRMHEERRVILHRDADVVDGVRVKSVVRADHERTSKAENDDIAGDSLAARRAAKRRAEEPDE